MVSFFSSQALWHTSKGLRPYPQALEQMTQWVQAIADGQQPQRVWLIEHPPLYTLGTSAKEQDVLGTHTVPTYASGRGGQTTYHGPGQRVVYVMLNLNHRQRDLHQYIRDLEAWLILALSKLGVDAFRREGRVGIWVETSSGESKIAAIGVRVQKWITSHGIALNVCPDLDYFKGIIPCGLQHYGVTSLQALGKAHTLQDVDTVLHQSFQETFQIALEESIEEQTPLGSV